MLKINILTKIRLGYFFVIFAMLNLSCTDHIHYTRSMRVAEQIMDSLPDSARILLSRDSEYIQKTNEATRMYFSMLSTLVDDKCYIPHTSDSIMLKVADYYQYHGTPHQKFMSYYLLGRIYTDMNLTADAFDYYNKALSVKDMDSSFIYVARANNQIGHLYMYQDMYRKALPYFYATYKYAVVAKDTSVMVFALRDIGRVYDELNDAKNSIIYYERSVNLLQKSNLYRLGQHIYPEVATI
jgi:tetratricopeptide (TPR) repeat protein